jgi:hypothetical protein
METFWSHLGGEGRNLSGEGRNAGGEGRRASGEGRNVNGEGGNTIRTRQVAKPARATLAVIAKNMENQVATPNRPMPERYRNALCRGTCPRFQQGMHRDISYKDFSHLAERVV